MIIGISGKARSGKDESFKVIQQLVPQLGLDAEVKRYAFADAVKREVFEYIIGPLNLAQSLEETLEEENRSKFRTLWQFWGTEVRRVLCDEQYWTKQLQYQLLAEGHWDKILVVTDMRFPDELQMLKEEGAYCVRLSRETVKFATSEHASETSLDHYREWDYVIDNNGPITDLKAHWAEILVDCWTKEMSALKRV